MPEIKWSANNPIEQFVIDFFLKIETAKMRLYELRDILRDVLNDCLAVLRTWEGSMGMLHFVSACFCD